MKILISCGEPSGDLYAGALVREIRALDSEVHVYGLGGAKLRESGAELVEDYRGLTVTGLSEALSVLPRSFAIYRRLVRLARADRPDVFVPVDFPDFNFRLARALHRLGIPIVYYVCPQVWAWRRGRLRTLKTFSRRALVIFPFEEALYQQAGIPAEFVGHPLLDLCQTNRTSADLIRLKGLTPGKPTVALLPGSRPNEVRAILADLVRSALLVRQSLPGVQFLVARAPDLDDELFAPLVQLSGSGAPLAVVESQTDDVLAAADVVVTASGTATIQAAIHGKPMVIVYRLSPLSYRIVRAFAHVDSVGMVNVVAGESVVPEFIQEAFTPVAVSAEVVRFLCDPEHAKRTRISLGLVRDQLGVSGASRRAAEAVLAEGRSGRLSSSF
jgi:lipid-A-disaccharide synthase